MSRKLYNITKKRKGIAERLLADEGITPLELLVQVMRGEREYDKVTFEAAVAAAPFMHPKLRQIDIEASIETTNYAAVPRAETYEEWLKVHYGVGSPAGAAISGDKDGSLH